MNMAGGLRSFGCRLQLAACAPCHAQGRPPASLLPKPLSTPPRGNPPQAIHSCAVRFPDVAASVLHLLCDFLSDTNTASALDVIYFIREIIQVGWVAEPGLVGCGMERCGWLTGYVRGTLPVKRSQH